jgi:tripartite-type tricarboxylate transporter receptor subunit TctC
MTRRILLAAALLAFAAGAYAQTFPTRTVRLVVPFAPGGGADTQARILTQKLSEVWGQPVIIENRGGAGSTIASALVAKAAPDGYTLYNGYSAHVISGSLYRSLPYDPIKDFTPISLTVNAPFTLIVRPDAGIASVRQLIDAARAKPGSFNWASTGIGASPHVAGELFVRIAAIKATHIPYKGSSDVIPALLGGQIHYTFADSSARPLVEQGKFHALAVTGARRWPLLPNVPTMAEAGVPGVEITTWTILMAPAGIPEDLLAHIGGTVRKILRTPEVSERYAANGYEVIASSAREAADHLASEHAKYARIVKELGLKVD